MASIGQCLVAQRVSEYRPEDAERLDAYWNDETLDSFSRELFGVDVAALVGLSATDCIRDWRNEALAAALIRAEQNGHAA